MSTSPPTTPPDRSTPSAEPPGISPSPHRGIWRIVDGAVILGTWGLVLWLVVGFLLHPTRPRLLHFYIYTAFLLPAFIVPWLFVRVLIAATPLLDSTWRAQLAVTPLDPARYLWRRLRAPFLWSILALPLAQMTLLATLEARSLSRTGNMTLLSLEILKLLAVLSLFGLPYCIAVAGVFDQLRRQCARGGAYSVGGTLVWVLLSFGVPLGTFQGIDILTRTVPSLVRFRLLLIGPTSTTLCVAALVYARRCWKRTCRTYFDFEPAPTLTVPETGAGGWE